MIVVDSFMFHAYNLLQYMLIMSPVSSCFVGIEDGGLKNVFFKVGYEYC